MSDYLSLTKPKTEAQWARSVEDRIQKLMNPTTVRVGDWVLSGDSAGDLVATKSSSEAGTRPVNLSSVTGVSDVVARVNAITATPLIPGLDASKITSGQFAPDMVEGLVETLDNIGEYVQARVQNVWNVVTGIISGIWTSMFPSTPPDTGWIEDSCAVEWQCRAR